jgi:hypothetical protein
VTVYFINAVSTLIKINVTQNQRGKRDREERKRNKEGKAERKKGKLVPILPISRTHTHIGYTVPITRTGIYYDLLV